MADARRHHVVNYRKEKLSDFLECCGLPPITMVDYDLSRVAERTRRRYLTELCSMFVALLQTLSPTNPGNLWKVLKSSDKICEALNLQTNQEKNASKENDKYLKALAETYNNASSRNVKRQVLSIIADLTTFEEIKSLLPGLTRYMFTEARKHRLVVGRGVPVVPKTNFRIKVDVSKLDHFISFITSPYIVQDLPFGQKLLKLSSGETIQTPNVIRVSVNEHIINQYEQYCKESDGTPLSRSTLRRILSACKASVRKCLQGLDNFHAEGSKAFDDISELVDKLGDSGSIETTRVQQLKMSLKLGKNYLKTDFKVFPLNSYILNFV